MKNNDMTEDKNAATPAPASRHFYGVSYSYGVAVSAETGDRYGADYHSFDSRAERDEWAEGGGDFRSSPDWRESILASDRELKKARS